MFVLDKTKVQAFSKEKKFRLGVKYTNTRCNLHPNSTDRFLMNNLENLSKLRKIHGKKQLELASKLSMSQQNYSRLERGERKMNQQQRQLLAEEFGIPLEILEDENLVMISSGQQGGAAANIQRVHPMPEEVLDGYKMTIKALEDQVLYLKEQNAQLLALLKHQ
jgi:transcriptional regulator with XRE-family HTH domain